MTLTATLSEDEIQEALTGADLPGWRLEEGKIVKRYRFPTFMEAIQFIVRLAEKAEEANHHPHLENHFHHVAVALHTWAMNGITNKDLALAREIESVAGL